MFFVADKEHASADHGDDDSSGADRQQKLTTFAIHQHDSAKGYKEVDNLKNQVSPMSCEIRQTALQKDVGVVADNGVYARRLIRGQNDASEYEGDDVLTAQQRFARLSPGRGIAFLSCQDCLHLSEFHLGLVCGTRAEQGGVRWFLLPSSQKPARRLRHHQAADHKQEPGRQRHPKNPSPGMIFKGKELGGVAKLCYLVDSKTEIEPQ